jgi:ABC-type branched-subunit amino acid transport system ATPase component
LAIDPELLLLDEPAAGMNPNEIDQLMEFIQWIRTEFKLTILLIEHQMKLVMGFANGSRCWISANLAEGPPLAIQNHPKVLEAYLGQESGGMSGHPSQAIQLEVRDLEVHYDGIRALQGVSFSVPKGEIVTLIGANGAGKTSILRAISGLTPYTGAIVFEGQDLQRVPAHQIVGRASPMCQEGVAFSAI